MTVAEFARATQIFDCGDSGRDYAADVRIPTIPQKWTSPELREVWIQSYLTELRNRFDEAARKAEPVKP